MAALLERLAKAGHSLAGLVLTIMACLWSGVAPAHAQTSPSAVKVRFESDPPGALVCERHSGALACRARTPCKLDLSTLQAGRTVEIQFKRFGFETQRVAVSADDQVVRVTLRRREIFLSPAAVKPQDAATVAVRERVYAALASRIYGPGGLKIDEGQMDLVGRFALEPGRDGHYLIADVLLADGFKRSLRELRGPAEPEARLLGTAALALHLGGANLMSQLAQALAPVPDNVGLMLRLSYRKTRSVLDDEIQTYLTTTTWQSTVGNREYINYYFQTETLESTVVRDITDLFGVTVRVPPGRLGTVVQTSPEQILKSLDVMANDTPRKQFRVVGQAR